MASNHHQEKGKSNRIEWFQQMYREWKEKNMAEELDEMSDYLDEDEYVLDFMESMLR